MTLKEFLDSNKGKKLVFTNGCFDILHKGHVAYLNEAKALGDLLIVGLNSDQSVRGLKGPERPVNSELDRKFVLENLKSVDFVEIFNDSTPYDLIKEVMPDILVKGGDWKPEDIVGSDIVLGSGGKVMSLNFVNGYSTTNIISKINK
ncbi:MAG: D-glycero-beta-D-manno-heptose 1-phosphate adenylyltransferase [Halobacteriovoraceae bacterium]|nr:D-glycero-beta-D-manno-heptose 1-phosphate adenylyltransferase [Halobacteriovoraceae bacterium]|tara:strand:+ start:71104 stop:71544 length:441 start_codon:yes stop_codon:yes gene_type:complete